MEAVNIPQQPKPIIPAAYEEQGSSTKKKILIFVIILFLLTALASVILFFVFPLFSNSKNVELVYWGLWEDDKVMKPIIADFERLNPNIKIKYEKKDITNFNDYVDRLTTRISQGNGPDIYRYHSSWPIQLRGYLLPLPSNSVKALELPTAYYKVIDNDLNINGAYYGVPLQIDTLALFINNELFKAADINKPPKTWDELTTHAINLSVPDETGQLKTAGVALGTFDNIFHASDIISLLFVQNRVNLYNISSTQKNAVDALGPKFYTAFSTGGENLRGKTWDSNMENSKVAFTKGNLAMYFGYSWDIFEIKAKNPSLDFSIVPVPHLPPDRNETIASYWVEGVSSKTKHQKEAFKFLEYLGRKDTLQKLYKLSSSQRLFGELYPRKDMKSHLSSNPLLKTFLDQADNAVSTPFSSDTFDGGLNSTLNVYLGNAVNAILSGTSAESAIETLAAGENQVMGKYNASQKK